MYKIYLTFLYMTIVLLTEGTLQNVLFILGAAVVVILACLDLNKEGKQC
ncbi:MAG: hypothetical protein ABS939_02635 [Psychrobacillus sp.]